MRTARGFGPTLLVWPISREPYFNCTVRCLCNQLACLLERGRSPGIIGKGRSDLDGYPIVFFVDERDGRSAFEGLLQDASRSLLNVGHASPNRPIRNDQVTNRGGLALSRLIATARRAELAGRILPRRVKAYVSGLRLA